ncbi:hypothetical protein VE02_05156 [Pseudogymnoascus sp. 03VT05]|nr:hypothetical protein VE02_05156 [Pseudogymnoascus sp. 03VT05]
MGEKLTDAAAQALLTLLRSDSSVDSKVASLTTAKSSIKQHNLPDACVPPLFESARLAMVSQHTALVNAGFTTLNHLLTRMTRQEPRAIVRETKATLPLVLERVGDAREKYRGLAGLCLTVFWRVAGPEVERGVREGVLGGRSGRAKEGGMGWIVQMHEEYGLQFRSFVPNLMELLEDADGMVRDCARNTVIELFQNAPNAAKSDLKKQLKAFNVRTTIVTAITSQLSPTGADPDPIDQHTASPNLRSHHSESNISASSTTARPVTPVIEQRVLEHVEPAYVNTVRELEDTLRDMHPFFDGKESEHNWLKREQSCSKLRKLNAGNAPADFHDAWLAGIKALLDGILKSVNSLRTSLSKEGCAVVQEIARTAGPGLDPMVEILLQNLIKLCGGTKKIASQAGDATVDIIISHVSYNQRILQHVWLACQDKNVQPRTYAAGWLKTLLKKLANHKSTIEHAGGLDIVEKCVKKGLTDPNPGVREKMRGTFWPFAQMWPAKSEAVMAILEPAQLKLLQNDPGNPNSPKKTNPVARPALSKSTGPAKPSLRETLLAQKKAAMAAKTLPARPGSAMSSFSPMRTASASSNSSTATAPPGRSRPESTMSSHGGLSVAPMRPTKFRPKEPPRPATAGPYSVRQAPAGATATPSTTRPAARMPSAATVSPKRSAVPRPNTSHSSHASQSSNASPIREKVSVAREAGVAREEAVVRESPRVAREEAVMTRESPRPKQQMQQQTRDYMSSPSKADEDFTMVIPTLTSLPSSAPTPASPPAPVQQKETPRLVTPAKSVKVYEDPFSSAGDDETTPRPPLPATVLEEVSVNEETFSLPPPPSPPKALSMMNGLLASPERAKKDVRLLDSGIAKVRAQSLDVHGFRKLQSLIRDSDRNIWSPPSAGTESRFDALLSGLFTYLAGPATALAPEKVQDVKAQILATIRAMLRKDREAFAERGEEGIAALLAARARYEGRAHIVAGLEVLAQELVGLGDADKVAGTVVRRLEGEDMGVEGCRTLSMGLRMLTGLLEGPGSYVPGEERAGEMGRLAGRCLESGNSGVRMDGVGMCVALHRGVGEGRFWEVMGGVGGDGKSLITYYIVKRQREAGGV